MRNAKLEMRNGGTVQKMKSTAEYKDGAGKGFPLDNEFPYGIIAIEKVPNGNGWPLIVRQINRQTVKGEAVFLLME